MRICKFCGKPIDEGQVWNPDNEGNGYHHSCLIEMEFRSRDRQLYNKGKRDVLERIRAEIFDQYPDHQCTGELTGYAEAIEDILEIIDKALKEQGE